MARNKGLSPRDIRILVGFAIFAEAILGYFLMIDPLLGKITREERNVLRQRMSLSDIQASLYTPQATVSNDLPVFTEPHGRGAILFQQQLGDWISEDGNQLTSLAMIPSEDKSLYQCNVGVGGSYATISKFLNRLEQPPYLLGLKKIAIKSESENERLQADIELTLPLAEQ